MKPSHLVLLGAALLSCSPRRPPQSLPPVRVEETSSPPEVRVSRDPGPFELWIETAFSGADGQIPKLRFNDIDLPMNQKGLVTGLALPGPNVLELLWSQTVSQPQSFKLRLELRSSSVRSEIFNLEELVTQTELRLGKRPTTKNYRFSFPESHPEPLWWKATRTADLKNPQCRISGFGRVQSCQSGASEWIHRFEHEARVYFLKPFE